MFWIYFKYSNNIQGYLQLVLGMRFLCLHGQGTSAAVFRSQTAPFRSRLPSDYTFDFVNAPFPCKPYPGIDLICELSVDTFHSRQSTKSAPKP